MWLLLSNVLYYRLQKFANTFLCESSRQVGSTSRRPLGDAVAGDWSWTDQSRTKTPSAANLKATPAEKGVRGLVQAIVPPKLYTKPLKSSAAREEKPRKLALTFCMQNKSDWAINQKIAEGPYINYVTLLGEGRVNGRVIVGTGKRRKQRGSKKYLSLVT